MKKILSVMLLAAVLIFATNNPVEAQKNFQPLYVKPVVNVQGAQAQVVNCREWITLRGEPSTSGESLARIPLGAFVTRYQDVPGTDFCIVGYNRMLGYALKYYIRSTGIEY